MNERNRCDRGTGRGKKTGGRGENERERERETHQWRHPTPCHSQPQGIRPSFASGWLKNSRASGTTASVGYPRAIQARSEREDELWMIVPQPLDEGAAALERFWESCFALRFAYQGSG